MKIILTLAILLASLLCTAQKNFYPGYIVTKTGDTTIGNIKYANWEQNPRKIEFQQTGKEAAILGLTDLTAFEITGQDRYEKYIVFKSGRPTDISRLKDPFPESPVRDTVFLRVLVKGKTSLYELVENRNYYYIKNANGEVKELEHWLEPQVQSADFYTRDTYKGQLREIMSGADFNNKINSRINNITYTEKSLVDIVGQLNQLKGEAANTWKTEKKKSSYVFVGTGVNIAKMNFGGSSPEFSTLNYTTSVTPSFRAGVDFAPGRNLQRLILRAELAYQTLQFTGTSNIDKGSPFERDIKYDIKLNIISPTVHILYNVVSQNQMDFYLGLGMSMNFSNNTNRHLSTYINGQQVVRDPFLDFHTNWMRVHAKAGLMISKKIDININFLAGGFVDYSNFNGGATVVGLEVNYRFQGGRR